MSHVASIKTKPGEPMFASLEALQIAAGMCHGEIVKQTTYHWYMRHVGDYPLPEGMRAADLGKNATYVFRIKPEAYKELGIAGEPYEMGLVEDPNNPGCYVPVYDFWAGGHGLDKAIGAPLFAGGDSRQIQMLGPKLKQCYDMACDALAARQSGDAIEFLTARDAHAKYPDAFPRTDDTDTWVSVVDPTNRVSVGV